MEKEKILKELVESLPEIYGGFICDQNGQLLASSLSIIASEQACEEIAARVQKIYTMVSIHFHDITRFQLAFHDTILLAYLFQSGGWLFVSHTQDAVPGVIQVTVNVAIQQLEQKQQTGQVPVTVQTGSLGENAVPDTGVVEKALIKVIGPIGSILCEEAVKKWQEASSQPSDVNVLLELIGKELDDEQQYQKFLEIFRNQEF